VHSAESSPFNNALTPSLHNRIVGWGNSDSEGTILMKKSLTLILAGLAVLPVLAFAQDAKPATAQEKTAPKIETKAQAADLLKVKADKMTELRDESQKVLSKMSEIKIDGSQESARALQEMADALKTINEQLKTLQEEIEDIKGWIEGQNEALPILSQDVTDLKKNRFATYMQFQYRMTNQSPTATDKTRTQSSFNFRRIRVGSTQTIDPKTSVRFSFDLATGTQQNAAQLRDGWLVYTISPAEETAGVVLRGGQFPLALGYELARSSGDRELPERSAYNVALFNGERSQGLDLTYGLNPNWTASAAVVNSLTYGDPEQSAKSPSTNGRRPAYVGALRYHDEKLDYGVSMYRGSRPIHDTGHKATSTSPATSPNVIAPEIRREFLYLDASYIGLFVPQLVLRGEYMTGKDRRNLGSYRVGNSYEQVSVKGWQAQATYNLSNRNQFNFRIDEYDPNTAIKNNVTKTYAAGYSYFLNPNSKIGLTLEEVRTNSDRYRIVTMRTQFRF
jgi:hypothetical protein